MAQQISILGIDIAKLVLYAVGMDDTGPVVLRKRIVMMPPTHVWHFPNQPKLRPLDQPRPRTHMSYDLCVREG